MTTSSTDATSQESVAGAGSIPATSATTSDVPAFGWSGYAERVNGRFAMVGLQRCCWWRPFATTLFCIGPVLSPER